MSIASAAKARMGLPHQMVNGIYIYIGTTLRPARYLPRDSDARSITEYNARATVAGNSATM